MVLAKHNNLQIIIFLYHIGIENISVEPNKLYEAVSALRRYGFNYLQCQGGYDEGPGKNLVSFYHFITVDDLQKIKKIKEVRLKVFLKRDSDLSIPSLYKIFKGSDWQERETFDMYGINFIDHPNPKRLLMPEDWRGSVSYTHLTLPTKLTV